MVGNTFGAAETNKHTILDKGEIKNVWIHIRKCMCGADQTEVPGELSVQTDEVDRDQLIHGGLRRCLEPLSLILWPRAHLERGRVAMPPELRWASARE